MAPYVESFFGSVYIFYQVNTLPAACIFKSLKIFENFRIFSKFSTIVIFPLPCWGMVRNPSALQSTFWSFLLKLPFEDPFKDPPAQGELRNWINIVRKSPLNNSAYIHRSILPKYGFPRTQRKIVFGFFNYIPSSNLQFRFPILRYFSCFGHFIDPAL